MRQVVVRKGAVVVEDVPAPMVEPGTLLVRVERSSISVGTELSGIRASGLPVWRRAARQPGKVRRVLEVATSQGVVAARDIVNGALSTGAATGYSAAGTVVEVGAGVDDVGVGVRVACAGAQAAHHAEYIRVPRNLAVTVDGSLPIADASTVTLGAIALQGIRRANPTIGETFVVIGLGVLGQLTAQILSANGCRVVGIDTDPDRVRLARSLGMESGFASGSDDDITRVARLTGGVGADGVIVTAASAASDTLSLAFRMTRKRAASSSSATSESKSIARISTRRNSTSSSRHPTALGATTRHTRPTASTIPWGMSDGPRIGTCRSISACWPAAVWSVEPLVAGTYPLAHAVDAYEAVRSGTPRPVLVLLSYPEDADRHGRIVTNPVVKRAREGQVGAAVVGAGAFAKSTHLPAIKALKDQLSLEAVVSRSGLNAKDTARQFGARYSTTDYRRVLEDEAVELVVITTRHNMHADMALEALEAGKHVLVEKRLASPDVRWPDPLVLRGLLGRGTTCASDGFQPSVQPIWTADEGDGRRTRGSTDDELPDERRLRSARPLGPR